MTLLFLLFLFFHLEIVIKRHKKKYVVYFYTFKTHHFYFILLKYKHSIFNILFFFGIIIKYNFNTSINVYKCATIALFTWIKYTSLYLDSVPLI
jgi:hypothetical protein